jgi:hypothetical protein
MESEPDFAKGSGAVTPQAVAPPFFGATMTRDSPIGAIISILVGLALVPLYSVLKGSTFNSTDPNTWIIGVIAQLAGDESVGNYIGAVISIPTSTISTPLVYLQYIYAAFLLFPSNLSWFAGAFIVAAIRVRKGRDEGNLKPGWDTFWYGAVAIEIPFLVFGVIFLISSINAGAVTLQGFTGSVLLFFLLFFLMPMFWIAMLMSLLGSLLGSVIMKKKS